MCMTRTCLQVRRLRLTGVRTLRTFGAKYQNLPYISPYREFHEIGSKVRKVRSPITLRDSEGSKNKNFHRPFLAVSFRARQPPFSGAGYAKTGIFTPVSLLEAAA